jgi:uncharacterized protein (DUF2141 family)
MMEDELVALAVYASVALIALTIYVRRTVRPLAAGSPQDQGPFRRLARKARKPLLGLAAVASLGALPVQAANLAVTIAGIHSNAGEILIGLYDREDAFKSAIDSSATKSALLPQTWRIFGAALRAKAGSQSIIFTQLPPGRYAIIAFQDENDNGLLDENALGVPIEGVGFSNNAQGFLSAPSFDKASIDLGSADRSISISLVYHHLQNAQDEADLKKFFGH